MGKNGESMVKYGKFEGVWENMDGGGIGKFLADREVESSVGEI